MSQSLLSNQAQILPCPSCGEMIYSNSSTCRFCNATIDPEVASAGADLQTKVNDACNRATTIRNIAGAMWAFYAVARLIPFIGLVGLVGVGACFVIIPVGAAHWQVKYGRLPTTDIDYKKAKRNLLIALILWLVMGVVLALVVWALFLAK
jgi:hypothetical protein